MKKYILVPLTLLLFLVGCSKPVDVLLDDEITVLSSSNSEKKVQLTAKDAEYILLKEWLIQHRGSWLSTSGRYPGGVYLTSGEYGIQVTDSKVILYTNIADNPTAIYAQEIERSDLKILKDLGR